MGQATFTWLGFSTGWQNVGAGADILVSLATVATSATLRRIIYDFHYSIQSPVDGDASNGMIGAIAVDARAVAAGIAAMPRPITGGDQEWLFTKGFAQVCETDGGGAGTSILQNAHVNGDIRTMRKMKQTDQVVMVCENVAGDIRICLQGRILFSV